jgi:hypothetical protein
VNDAPLVTLAAEYNAVRRAGQCVVAVTNFTVTDVDSTTTELYNVAISTQLGELLLPVVPAEATVTRSTTDTAATAASASSTTVVVKGTLAAVQAALASAVYSCTTANSSTVYTTIADTLTVTATDGHGAVSTAVWAPVIISTEQQPPLFKLLQNDVPLQALEDEPLLIGALLELALSADDSTLLTVTASAERGSLSTSIAASTVTTVIGDRSESNGQLVFRGGLTAVNAALAELTYTSASNAHGRDTITLTASSSSRSSSSSSEVTAAAAVPLALAVVIAPVNDAPVVLPPLEVKLSADSIRAVMTGLSVVDVDVTDEQYDSETVTVTLSSARGSIVLKRSDGLQFTEGKPTITCNI